MKKYIIFLLVIFVLTTLKAQIVHEQLSNDIYLYLERLSQKGILEFDDLVKPVSRKYISGKLIEAQNKADLLSPLEKEELEFYKKEYWMEIENFTGSENNADTADSGKNIAKRYRMFSYSDKVFKFGASPIAGYQISYPGADRNTHSWFGIYGFSYFLNSIGVSFEYKTNNEQGNSVDSKKDFTPETGAIVSKHDYGKNIDYSDVNSTISYDWKWGDAEVAKDYIEYGYAKSGNIVLSNKAPSFPYFRIHLNPVKWLNFSYFHAWLSSDVIDTLFLMVYRRDIFVNKYYAFHALTVTPLNGLDLTIGESIVYSYRMEPLYLMPFMCFYLADDWISNRHDKPGDANSQIFFSVSSKNHIKNTHLYGTVFIDELTLKGINGSPFVDPSTIGNSLDDKRLRPQLACTIGLSVTDLPIDNLTFTTEYTRINPYVYGHHDPAQTYTSSSYLLGDWIGHNADLFYLNFNYRFIRGLQADLWSEYIRKGSSDYSGQYKKTQPPFLFGLKNYYKYFGINIKYELIHDLNFELNYKVSQISNEQTPGNFENTNINELAISAHYGF